MTTGKDGHQQVGQHRRRVRRTLHVDQEICETAPGQIRTTSTTKAREERDDGMVEEVEREEILDSSEESPWFSTGTIRTRRRRTTRAES